MDKLEHIVTCISEECAEISQIASKSLRFGLNDTYEEKSNIERLNEEINDPIAVIELLSEECDVVIKVNDRHIEEKKAKVLRYMRYPRERGTLE